MPENNIIDAYDLKILAEIADPGSQKDIRWGAGMAMSLEYLRKKGYVSRDPIAQITPAGQEALDASR